MEPRRRRLPNGTPPEKRFPAWTDQSGDCWLWMGAKNTMGYGRFSPKYGARTWLAHRYAYQLWVGPIPAGLCVLHRCDNPLCVRPTHLFLGTRRENSADMVTKGRQARGSALYRKGPRKPRDPATFARGERIAQAKLTEDQVREIRRRRAAGEPNLALARFYQVAPSCISQIASRQKWRHVEDS